MTKMIWMAGGTFLQFAVFLALGSLVLQWVKRDQKSLTAALVTGYFSYFGLFELVCLPMVFLKCSLTLFTVMMTVISGGGSCSGVRDTEKMVGRSGKTFAVCSACTCLDAAGADCRGSISVLCSSNT